MASMRQKTKVRRSLKHRPNRENLKKDLKRMSANLAILREATPSEKIAE